MDRDLLKGRTDMAVKADLLKKIRAAIEKL
jgi:hypothetical protein